MQYQALKSPMKSILDELAFQYEHSAKEWDENLYNYKMFMNVATFVYL